VLTVRRGLSLFIASWLVAVSAAAHDFWIEAESFRPGAGSLVGIHLKVGEHFAGEEVARDPRRIERFALVTASGETPVTSGLVRVTEPGILVYRSRGNFIELPAEKFEQFVEEEGLQWLRAERRRLGESDAPWRESFSRCAKALLGTSPVVTKPAGLRLELIPQTNPAVGKSLPVRLEFEGRPVRGALVVAMNAEDPSKRIERRTDARGRVELPLARAGMWLVKSVHVVRAPAGGEADWESLWASLTFDVR
jgi:Domain of unknown function (DUF4198)